MSKRQPRVTAREAMENLGTVLADTAVTVAKTAGETFHVYTRPVTPDEYFCDNHAQTLHDAYITIGTIEDVVAAGQVDVYYHGNEVFISIPSSVVNPDTIASMDDEGEDDEGPVQDSVTITTTSTSLDFSSLYNDDDDASIMQSNYAVEDEPTAPTPEVADQPVAVGEGNDGELGEGIEAEEEDGEEKPVVTYRDIRGLPFTLNYKIGVEGYAVDGTINTAFECQPNSELGERLGFRLRDAIMGVELSTEPHEQYTRNAMRYRFGDTRAAMRVTRSGQARKQVLDSTIVKPHSRVWWPNNDGEMLPENPEYIERVIPPSEVVVAREYEDADLPPAQKGHRTLMRLLQETYQDRIPLVRVLKTTETGETLKRVKFWQSELSEPINVMGIRDVATVGDVAYFDVDGFGNLDGTSEIDRFPSENAQFVVMHYHQGVPHYMRYQVDKLDADKKQWVCHPVTPLRKDLGAKVHSIDLSLGGISLLLDFDAMRQVLQMFDPDEVTDGHLKVFHDEIRSISRSQWLNSQVTLAHDLGNLLHERIGLTLYVRNRYNDWLLETVTGTDGDNKPIVKEDWFNPKDASYFLPFIGNVRRISATMVDRTPRFNLGIRLDYRYALKDPTLDRDKAVWVPVTQQRDPDLAKFLIQGQSLDGARQRALADQDKELEKDLDKKAEELAKARKARQEADEAAAEKKAAQTAAVKDVIAQRTEAQMRKNGTKLKKKATAQKKKPAKKSSKGGLRGLFKKKSKKKKK